MKQFIRVSLLFVLLVVLLEAKKAKDVANNDKRQKRQDVHETVHQSFETRNAEPINALNLDQQSECQKPQKLKLKYTKQLSAYEQCKQECKRRRDENELGDYVNQLREELKVAEERLVAQREEQERAQQAGEHVENQDQFVKV